MYHVSSNPKACEHLVIETSTARIVCEVPYIGRSGYSRTEVEARVIAERLALAQIAWAEDKDIREVASEFVRRVEAGEVRSVRTYAAFKKALGRSLNVTVVA